MDLSFWISVKGLEIEDTVENEELEPEPTKEEEDKEKEDKEEEEIETPQGISFLIRHFLEKILF